MSELETNCRTFGARGDVALHSTAYKDLPSRLGTLS